MSNTIKRIWTFGLGLLVSVGLSAQIAEDFSVTDIQGQDHELYADYLNEGKVMVMGFFYIGAPMLEELFPELQNFAWAAWNNELPVDFILMSNYDSNADLQMFAYDHSIDLPIVGEEGGASVAMSPYTDGTYGDFYGYPMFVVVGPDGEVIYDPWGENLQDVLDALEDAILDLAENAVSVNDVAITPEPQITSLPQGIQLEVPAEWEGSDFGVYATDGKLVKKTRLTTGRSIIPVQETGILLYNLQHKRGVRTGKLLR